MVQYGERPRPVCRPGEVLVRVKAASVNRVDLYMRDSGAGITHHLPQIMGVDGAGVIEEVDAEERFALADVHQALSQLESGRQFGKVAVEVG